MKRQLRTLLLPFFLLIISTGARVVLAQFEPPALGDGPWVFDTYDQGKVELSLLARGMDHPFGMVFLPGTATAANPLGDILINERTGKVRLFRNGRLVDKPVIDMTRVLPVQQLFDIKLHPDFAKNHEVYFTWIKQAPNPDGTDKLWATTAVARATWDGNKLSNVREVFEADAWSDNICGASSRMHFLKDNSFLLGVSHRCDTVHPQTLDSDIGKILRLNDDGSVPKDNPFIGVEGAKPEIYSWGHRSVMDFTDDPATGAVWELENGPQGGDEVNIIKPGANYGWPKATFGRDYDGKHMSPLPWIAGTELPEVFWVPSITVAGLTFYTGDRFPKWKGNLFVTSMIMGRIPGTGHLERVVFNENGEVRREQMFNELKQRIRYVQQGPNDGLLYLLTDSSDGALLRIEPAAADAVVTTALNASGAALPPEKPLFPNTDCQSCHRLSDTLVGPSFRAIAARYRPTDANIAQLADKIMQGGAGSWGDTPMAPHPDIAHDTAMQMARTILKLGTK